MGSSSGEALANDSMAELFGPPRRRPLLSNTLRTLSRVYSLFPEENPFSQFADCAHTPAVWQACNAPRKVLLRRISDVVGDDTAPRSEKATSVELNAPDSVEVRNLPIGNEMSNEGTAEILHKDSGVNRSEMIIDELNGGNETEAVGKVASNEKDTKDHMEEVQNLSQGLFGIESILMDELDDLGLLQLSDEDINFDLLKEIGSFKDTNDLLNDSMPVGSSGNGKLPLEGNVKENVVIENKGKYAEAQKSTSGGNAGQSHGHLSMEREKAGCSEVGNQSSGTSPQVSGRKDIKVYKRKVLQDPSKIGGLTPTAQRSTTEGGTMSGSKVIDSIEKGHNSVALDKRKTKKSKKAALKDAKSRNSKDVKSGKSKHISVDGEGSRRKSSAQADLAGSRKMLEQNLHVNKENLPAKLVGICGLTNPEKLRYTREQLMHLRKLAAVPEDMLKTVKEISAQLHGEEWKPSIEEAMDASVSSKGQLGISIEDKKAEDKLTGILKKKKRGTSSEARKEKKKQKRRKKRAELNKKLGVKRLKLKPNLKPKVVPPCRHYLKGRCNEGEKCKFSHDVVPLTKSKPCRHFARHTCMKGDDCPYDHQLSKYPCDNYVETGFCSRGDSCLFSHTVPAKGASDTTVGVSKGETCSLDQLNESNSTQQLNANVSSGIAVPKHAKENMAVRISQPAKAPKGLTFLSFGKPSVDNSGKREETAISKLDIDLARTSGQPNPAISVNLGNTSMSILAAPTPQRASFLPPERSSVESSGTKDQASADVAGTSGQRNPTLSAGAGDLNKALMSFAASTTPQRVTFLPLGKTLVDNFVTKSQENADVAGTSSQPKPMVPGRAGQSNRTLMGRPASPAPQGVSFLAVDKTSADSSGNKNQASLSSSFLSFGKPLLHESAKNGQVNSAEQLNGGTSGEDFNVCKMYRDSPSSLTPKRTSGPFLDGSDHKLQAGRPTDGHSGSHIANRSANESDKLKAVHSKPWGSPSSGQCSSREGGQVKSTPGTAQRALLSTLAFAAKYESGIKMSLPASNEVRKNEGASDSRCKQKEPIKASAILELLYGGSRKEKQ